MKKILIVYPKMIIGGTTTSLLSVLRMLDYSRYHVDLLFMYDDYGELVNNIPAEVKIIGSAYPGENWETLKKRRYRSCGTIAQIMIGMLEKHITKNPFIYNQRILKDAVSYSKKIKKKYDIAISFQELWAMYYVAKNVKANRKLAWIHLDYKKVGFKYSLDRDSFSAFNSIVTVSKECCRNMQQVCMPDANKIVCIENILNHELIRERAKQLSTIPLQKDSNDKRIRFLSVCRIVYSHKGLDRALDAFHRLRDEGFDNFIWYIIGSGIDEEDMKKRISEFKMTDCVMMLGSHQNPMPFESTCDIFLLPSVYEGKPMAVTEAQMLGLVPAVTNYASAKEQVRHGIDGYICDNSVDGIYKMLKDFVSYEVEIGDWKQTVAKTDYSNSTEMKKVFSLLDSDA